MIEVSIRTFPVIIALILLIQFTYGNPSSAKALFELSFPRRYPRLPGWVELKKLTLFETEILGLKVPALKFEFYDILPKEIAISIYLYVDRDRNPKTGYDGADVKLSLYGKPSSLSVTAYYYNSTGKFWKYLRLSRSVIIVTAGNSITITMPLEVIGSLSNLKYAFTKLSLFVSVTETLNLRS